MLLATIKARITEILGRLKVYSQVLELDGELQVFNERYLTSVAKSREKLLASYLQVILSNCRIYNRLVS